MADELKTIANWAKELGISEKKLKDAVKVAAIAPDQKKGVCCMYSQKSMEKAKKAVKSAMADPQRRRVVPLRLCGVF